MRRPAAALAGALRRLLRSTGGGASVEFVVVFPLFVTIFLSSFEASMVLVRQMMLERALDVVMRDMRLKPEQTFPAAILRRSVCRSARVLPNCDRSLVIEITPVDRATYALPATRVACTDRGTAAVPADDVISGRIDQIVIVRGCYSVKPFFRSSLLGAELVKGGPNEGEYAIVAASAFAQEPGR